MGVVLESVKIVGVRRRGREDACVVGVMCAVLDTAEFLLSPGTVDCAGTVEAELGALVGGEVVRLS